MNRINNIYNKINFIFPYLAFIFLVACGVLVIFSYSLGINYYDYYDYYEGVFWAKASIDAKAIVNTDFSYYYFLPFGANLLMIPFVKFFGVTYLANQLGMVLFFIIYLLTVYKLSRSIFKETYKQLIFCVIALLFVYTYVGDNLLHHILGYGIGAVCLMGELSCIINIKNNKNIKTNYLLLVIYLLWGSSNGLFTIALANAPVIASLLIYDFLNKIKLDKKQLVLYTVLLLTTLIGFIVFKHYETLAISSVGFDSRYEFGSLDRIQSNINNIIKDYIRISIFNDTEYIPFFSGRGVFTMFKIVLSLMILLYPTVIIYRQLKNKTVFTNEPIYIYIYICKHLCDFGL